MSIKDRTIRGPWEPNSQQPLLDGLVVFVVERQTAPEQVLRTAVLEFFADGVPCFPVSVSVSLNVVFSIEISHGLLFVFSDDKLSSTYDEKYRPISRQSVFKRQAVRTRPDCLLGNLSWRAGSCANTVQMAANRGRDRVLLQLVFTCVCTSFICTIISLLATFIYSQQASSCILMRCV